VRGSPQANPQMISLERSQSTDLLPLCALKLDVQMNSPTKLKTPSRQWSPFSRSRPTLPDMSVRVENHRRAKFAETCSLVHHLNAVSHQWPDSIPMPVPDTPAPWMISPNGGHYKPYSALSSIRPNQRSASTPPFIANAPMLRATSVQSISQRSTNDRLR